ncbi:leucyl aminopeptidase [Candidatus Woesearchaeota archaeon]|nr:leucyl aminopeptidase [Candidatus Woesearchaeota archaeon]
MPVEVSLSKEQPIDATSDATVAFDFEGAANVAKYFGKGFADKVNAPIQAGDFQGKDGQVFFVYTGSRPARILLVGLGAKDKFHLNKLRVAAGQAVNASRGAGVEELAFPVFGKYLGLAEEDIVIAVAEASIMASHKFDRYKSDRQAVKLKKVVVAAGRQDKALEDALNYGRIVALNCITAKDLINEQASVANPKYIAEKAAELCKGLKDVKVTILDRKALQKIRANGMLAVGAGSSSEPRMAVVEYAPKGCRKTYALVGKGITFDSGGLDLKPAVGMELMKYDMSGAAAVLMATISAAQLQLPHRIIGVMALAENMIGPESYKPGDIITTMSGKTIEILNTDAEGRIVLADALHYSKSFNPDYIIDVATLTGACFVALGSEAAGIMGTDESLISSLEAAGEKTFERVWQLPLYPEYQEYVKSDFADMKNVTTNQPGSGAGASVGGKLLSNFVEGCKWAHVDIAGTAWADTDSGYRPKGATAFGVRLLVQMLKDSAK